MKRQGWSSEKVLVWAKARPAKSTFTSPDLVRAHRMSRQTAARLLRQLVEAGKLVKTGSTQSARYRVGHGKPGRGPARIKLNKKLRALSEDIVFSEVSLKLNLNRRLSPNALKIAAYAFTEMLNNAIDHSDSSRADVEAAVDKGRFEFTIRDHGIGIFNRLRRAFKFKSDEEAVEHLIKGKQTTAPSAHSGEGIFFTSKIADHMQIRSSRLALTFNNEDQDLSLANLRPLKGTEVSFRIKTQTRKSLQDLFKQFADDDFQFDRTTLPIILLKQSGTVSRSQARRLTVGLESFDHVILDFKHIKELGQGFADEMFRVFQGQNPSKILEVRNANSAVNFMIQRAKKA